MSRIEDAIQQIGRADGYLGKYAAIADLRRVRNELDAELERD